jgi:hypothetical protein
MKICFSARRAVGLTATAIFFLALALQAVSTRPVHAAFDDSTPVSTATPEGRLAVFDDVWETIQQRYYDQLLTEWIGKEALNVSRAAAKRRTLVNFTKSSAMLSPLETPIPVFTRRKKN